MRKYGRTDANQALIVRELRQIGCSVQSLSAVGDGCPDLLVGWRGRNLLLEVKDGTLPASKRKLTSDEKLWHAGWRGQVKVIHSTEEALQAFTEADLRALHAEAK